MSRVLPELFAAAVRRDGGAPFLTYYDDATGERIELSAVTTANWVAKTANLLVDEYDLEAGETVAIGLPPHWLGVVWALSAWSAGAALAVSGRRSRPRCCRSAGGSASRCRTACTTTAPRSTTTRTCSSRSIHRRRRRRRTTTGRMRT